MTFSSNSEVNEEDDEGPPMIVIGVIFIATFVCVGFILFLRK